MCEQFDPSCCVEVEGLMIVCVHPGGPQEIGYMHTLAHLSVLMLKVHHYRHPSVALKK